MYCTTSGQGYPAEHKHHRNVIALLQPGRKTPDSTNDCVNRFCLGSIITLQQKTAWRYPGRLQTLTLNPTQFQALLATLWIQAHSWRIYALWLHCPVVGKTTHSLAVFFGCMSRYLSAGNGRSDFHILLFNEHSTSLSNGALMGSHVTHHLHWSFGRQYQSHITHHHLHVLASSQARSGVKRSVWCAFVPGLCVSFCNDIIISSSSPVIEDTEGLLTEKRTERHLLMPSVWKCWI